MVGLLALCMLSIAAPAVSAANYSVAIYHPCNFYIAYLPGHSVVVDGNPVATTRGRWVCV